jgi:CheY-like chemotaxis protein/anti-sigma regulatory factor (Ser/Thr protein kinase)
MSPGKEHSVLVVDDESAMREFLSSVLEAEGYGVAAVENGESAVEELGRGEYGVVVLDVSLPGISGYEVLCRIRQEWPSVAVVVTTGYPSEEAVIQCMSLGAVRFLIKPFSVSAFLRAVVGALHDRIGGSGGDQGLTVSGGLRDWVEITAPSRQEYLDRLENFVDALYDVHLSPSDKDDLKIAISEIASNAMEWGNQRDSKRCIKVSYCKFPEEMVFKVEDEGEGFHPEEVPDPGANPIANIVRRVRDGKRVGGYGMYIVRKVMDKVVYSERGNVVILSKSLTGPQTASAEGGKDSNA